MHLCIHLGINERKGLYAVSYAVSRQHEAQFDREGSWKFGRKPYLAIPGIVVCLADTSENLGFGFLSCAPTVHDPRM